MMSCSREEAYRKLQQAESITFLTGAGISTPSGVPDYRSLNGIYQGQPEYLLSATCMQEEPEKFYEFVQKIYHPQAQPNVIHQKMAQLTQNGRAKIVTQNIDGLHEKAGSHHCTNFHGTLYECTCRKCGQKVPWQEYLNQSQHKNCGGQVRPDIVLYEEGFTEQVIEQAIAAVAEADLLVIVGTTFQVHPFCDLIHYRKPKAEILVVNQTDISLPCSYELLQENATYLFEM